MSEYFDVLEHRDVEVREQALFAVLPEALKTAVARAPAIAEQLQGVNVGDISNRNALANLPVIRKSELLERQLARRNGANKADVAAQNEIERVFGGFSTIGWGQALRVFASPGPIYEPESARADYWRFGRALFAAGFRKGMLVYNCFSYHFTPAGSMFETGAHAIGCTVFPGGIGQTEMQVQTILDLKPDGYTGTPSFLRLILEKADAMGVTLPSIKRALFSGEAFPPSLQKWFADRGIEGFQAYGTADLGLIAYETEARDGLVVAEDIILEIVRPGTTEPLPDGEVGEVVVTTLNPDYPLVRFGTGDLSAIAPGTSACGRTNKRIKGWLGRADQTTKVRGMFVHPKQVDVIARRFPQLGRARLVVAGAVGNDQMKLVVEVASADASDELKQSLVGVVREVTKLRAEIVFAEPGTLPNDGKIIDDVRSYE
ncbi:MAG: phenylacetate--CoA ligase [Alcaligenaceae bacterium]|nr:phenylacetate--CoA ligase [Alcaligenaceae bacterium]